MHITDKILSLPPYLSTSWKDVVSLQIETHPFGHALIIELVTGSKVKVPNLEKHIIEKMFTIHAKVIEEKEKPSSVMTTIMPFPFVNMEGLMTTLQHNPEQKNTPPIPSEVLEKISAMTKGLLPEDTSSLAQPESNCQCPHCQIMRAVLNQPQDAAPVEEEVSDEDLKFRLWDIKQEGDSLYCVSNPLDHKEHYSVFLGNPLGCTCGQKNCEHIQAVLKS